MHDAKDHIDHPCPNCGKDGLHWLMGEIHCDACDCSWTIAEFRKEPDMDDLPEII
jgi:hypothetical protein